MAKAMYLGVETEVPIYEENVATVVITADNISSYFTVQNDSYYFAGSGNVFTTNNGGKNSTTAKTTLVALQDISNITFDYSYSSEANYDKFTLTVGGTTVENAVSGSTTNKSYTGSLSKGASIVFTYAKDGSSHSNLDKCTFSNMNITCMTKVQVGTETKEVAQKAEECYIGINNVAKKIKKAYFGVNGIARQVYGKVKQGRFVCVGASGKSYYSLDGETWASMSGATQTFRGVAYGNGRFVAVHGDGGAYYSLDGETWVAMTGLNASYPYYAVTYGNDRFVCVGANGKSYYSLDGETWKAMSGLDSSNYFYGVTYGNDRFVCVGASGKSYYSTNGTSWTAMSGLSTSYNFNAVAYGNGMFVCGGNEDGRVYYSTNGTSWTYAKQIKSSGQILCMAYGNGKFVCVFEYGYTYYSTDGKNWTSGQDISTCRGITYANDRFVAVGNSGKSYYSLDGINWVEMTGLASANYTGVCYGEIEAPDGYDQLVNYTMLYDGSLGDVNLNDCKDITGGWSLTYSYNSKVTMYKSADNIQLNSNNVQAGSKICMTNNPDFSGYTGIFFNAYLAGLYDTPSGGDLTFRSTTSKTKSGNWTSGFNYITIDSKVDGVGVKKFQYSATSFSGYLCFASYNGSPCYVYHGGVVKADNWQQLCTIAGLSPNSYADEETLCANSTAVETILSSKNAVEFMIKQCTGSFMASAVASSVFLAALNNSSYKTKIYANKHWSKFLTMIA